MDRRDFIKAVPAIAALPAVVSADEKKDTSIDPTKGVQGTSWPYRVYCYERYQGEWTFKENVRGSFASEREYMTFEEEEPYGYCGFMYDGLLHFQTFDDASDFVWMHVRAKDDVNILDTIYDIYYKNVSRKDSNEIQVGHYWFNGDTGSQIQWEQDGFNRKTGEGLTDWTKVESA